MNIVIVNCTATQASALEQRLTTLSTVRLLDDLGGAYNGWYQVSCPPGDLGRVRDWLDEHPDIENRFF